MVLEVLSYSEKLNLDLSSCRFDHVPGPNTTSLQYLRCMGSSSGDDKISSCSDFESALGHVAISWRIAYTIWHPCIGPISISGR